VGHDERARHAGLAVISRDAPSRAGLVACASRQ
jgi:hypothetical protein